MQRQWLLLLVVVGCAVCLCGVAQATEYHVGSGQQYATMNALLAAVTLTDNDIAWVHPGTYGAFTVSSGGGSSQATASQIRAYDPNNKPIFSGGTNTIQISSLGKWYKLEGIEQTGSTTRGIYHLCGGLIIHNCYVHGNAKDGIMSCMCNARDDNPGYLIVENCELTSNGSGTLYHNFYLEEYWSQVRYVWIHSSNGGTLYKDRGRNSTVEYNLMEQPSTGSGSVQFAGWDDSGMPDVVKTSTMTGNVITKNGGGNAWLFVRNEPNEGGTAGHTQPAYLYLYNNSLYSEAHTGPMLAGDDRSIIAAHNNIFHSTTCTKIIDKVDTADTYGQVLTSYNNWVKNTMTQPAEFTSSVTGTAPGWVNGAWSGGDFHLTSGSACRNAGKNGLSVVPNKEYLHPCSYSTRPSDGSIDIGAYEYPAGGSPPVANFTGNPTIGAAPLAVAFTDTSTNTPTAWAWTFGDSGTSTVQNPSHTYSSTGSFTVALTATNAYGYNTNTKNNYITVGNPPVANFSGTPTTGSAPLAVAFTDSSTNSPTAWSWTFGDGGTSTAQNPSHTYAAGTFTVALKATNAYGNNTNTKTNYITVSGSAPVANFTGTPTTGTVPLAVSFTDTSTNTPTSWAWTFGDGGASTAQNPSHTYSSTGSFTVALTATNAYGNNTNTKNNYITVSAGGAMPTFVAAGTVASGTGTITPALPAGIATNDILLLFLETANQAISISNQNGGTWAEVTGSPQGTGTAGGSSATRLTAFWSRYNGSQGAPTASDSGNHQLGRIVAIRGAATSGNPWDVTAGGVESTADTSGSIPGATTTVSNALVVAAIATALPDASGTANFSAWTNANLSSLTEQTDNTVTAGNGGGLGIAAGGKATAGAYGNTAVTCASSARKGMISIALKPSGGGGSAPVANFTGTPTSGTAPLSVSFTDTSTNTPTAWSWAFGDSSTSTVQNPSHSYAAGTYTVTLTATNAYGSDGETKTNYITASAGGQAPVANFSGTPTSGTAPLSVSFTDSSTNSPTAWSWNFGDSSTSTAQSPSHTYTAFGRYTVTLTATNAYGSDGETKTNYIAASTYAAATSWSLLCGTLVSGTVTEVQTSDNTYLQLRAAAGGNTGGRFTISTGLTPAQVSQITVQIEKRTSRTDATAKLDLTMWRAPDWTVYDDVWKAAAFGTSDAWIPDWSTTSVSTYMSSSGVLTLDFGGGCEYTTSATWDLYLDTVRVKLDP